MSSEKLPSERRPLASASDAAERLARIVDAAERAAAGVIDDAEVQAQRHLEQARDRADRIVAERLRELADELDPPGAPDTREARMPHLKPVGPAPEGGALRSREGGGPTPREDGESTPREGGASTLRRSDSSAARLLATQMAVSGASRREIEASLRAGFDIQDTSEILDAILGPEE